MLKSEIKRGFTLVELLITLLILVAVAGVVVPLFSSTPQTSQRQATIASMATIRSAIMGSVVNQGYRTDVGAFPTSLNDLVIKPSGVADYDPVTRTGWNGPYLDIALARLNDQGNADPIDDVYEFYDSFGAPFVLQLTSDPDNIRLVSAGLDGVIDSSEANVTPQALTAALRDDDLVLFLNAADPVGLGE